MADKINTEVPKADETVQAKAGRKNVSITMSEELFDRLFDYSFEVRVRSTSATIEHALTQFFAELDAK